MLMHVFYTPFSTILVFSGVGAVPCVRDYVHTSNQHGSMGNSSQSTNCYDITQTACKLYLGSEVVLPWLVDS